MKGFVITLVAVSFIAILLFFSTALHNTHLSLERSLTGPQNFIYAAALFDGVSHELNAIVGPEFNISQSNSSIVLNFYDSIPYSNHTSGLNAYENFLEVMVANESRANITVNLSNLTSEVVMHINEKSVYSNNMTGQNMFFTSEGGTDAESYTIQFTIYKSRSNVSDFIFNESGDLNVTIYYSDLNGSESRIGKVFSNSANTFRITYIDGSTVQIDVGQKYGNSGSLYVKPTDVNVPLSWSVTLPAINSTAKRGYTYDSVMTYKNGNILLERNLGK